MSFDARRGRARIPEPYAKHGTVFMHNKGRIRRSIAFRHANGNPHMPGASVENFMIDFDNGAGRVEIIATRTRDLLRIRFLLDGFTYNEKRNQLWQKRNDARVTLFLSSQHIAETIWQENFDPPTASRLYAPETRLVFERNKSTDAQRLSISKLFELVQEDAELCVSPRAKAKLASSLEEQLALLNPSMARPWEKFSTRELLQSLAALVVPPNEAQTSLELIGKMSMSPSEEARWDFGGDSDVVHDTELRPQVPLHTIRLLDGSNAGLRALHTRRFDTDAGPHVGLVGSDDIRRASGETDVEMLMALLPRHHRDLVAMTSIPGLPALMALDPESGSAPKGNGSTTDLPPSRVVRPAHPIKIKFIEEQEARHGLDSGNVGIALTQAYQRAQVSLTSQGATIDLRYAGEPPLLRLRQDGYDPSGNTFTGFNVEVSDYLTSLGMDWKVETTEKGYLFPLGLRCSLVTLVSRSAVEATDPDSGTKKRTSRANKIFFLKMNGEAKQMNGPYCPFEGRWFPATSVRMRTLLSPPLTEVENYVEQVPGKYALFWPKVFDPEAGVETDFEFEWQTDDGIARSKLLFVLNEYVGDEHVMRTLVKQYNAEPAALRMAHFSGTRHRYASIDTRADQQRTSSKPEDDGRGKTSFDTQYWVMQATGRIDPFDRGVLPANLDEQHFRMDGRMEGASQPPFYPRLEKARIRVQSADIMLARLTGGIDVNYYPPYIIKGFGSPHQKMVEQDGEVFLQVIGNDSAEVDGQNSKNRSGGVASFSSPVAAISRRVGVVGGQPRDQARIGPEDARYEFDKAARDGLFDPQQYLTKRPASTALAKGAVETSSSFSLVLGSLDLSKLHQVKKMALDHPSVPELMQQVELGPKVAEVLEEAATAADNAIYGSNGLASKIVNKIKDLQLDGLAAEDLFDKYWPTLVRMGFTTTATDPCEFRRLLRGVADTTSTGFAGRAVKFAKAVEQFGDETAAFVQNPVPRKIRETLERIEAVLVAARNRKLWQEVWQIAFAEKAKDALRGAFCQSFDLNSELAQLLFGKQLTCDGLLADPAGAFQGVENRLYGGSLSKLGINMQRLFGLIGGLKLPGIEWPGQVAVEQALRDAVFAIVDIVESGGPASLTGDILDHAEQNLLATKIHSEVKQSIDTIMQAGKLPFDDLDAFLASLRQRRARLEREVDQIIAKVLAELDDMKLPVKPEHKAKARERLAEELLTRLVRPWLLDPLDEALGKVETELANANEIHAKLVEAATEGLAELYDLSEMRKAIAQAGSIEEDVRGAIVELASKLLGAGDDQLAQLGKVRTKLENWSGSTPLPWPDKDLRPDLLALIDRIDRHADSTNPADEGGLQQQLDGKRAQIDQLAMQVIDTPLLKAVGDAVQLRTQIAEVVLAMATRLATQEGKSVAATTVPQGLVPDLAALVQLYLPLAKAVEYRNVEATIAKLKTQLAAAGSKADKLTNRVQENIINLRDGAAALHSDLVAAQSAETLVNLIHRRVPDLLALIDTRLAGDLTVFYSFPSGLFDDLDTAAREALQELWGYAGGPIRQLLDLFDEIAGKAKDAFDKLNDSEVRKYAEFVVGKTSLDDVETKLKAFKGSIDTTLKLLKDFDRDIDNLRDHYKELTTPLANTLQALFDALGKLRVQNGKQIVDSMMTAMLSDALRLAKEVAGQLLPTKLSTGFTWVTNLDEVVNDLPEIEFSSTLDITDREVIERFGGVAPDDIHMETKARFGMDMLSGEVTSEVRGRVAPLKVVVPRVGLEMATIYLDEITFKSVNGGKPDFHVTIKDVAMGKMLDFLNPLQSALAPGESGLYLLPKTGSVTVGYRYAMGEINLGAVRFLNLAFDISAYLPFIDDQAHFRFQLSTPEWPFLVVSDPYGGGGYLDLSVYPDGRLRQMILVAFFGAVSQVKFGPIRASGRIVSGLYVEQRKNAGSDRKIMEMRAFFEVSGRASVACFNLSLLFMVYLRQSGKNMEGKATLQISVKRGFLKYTFRADATQRIKGPGGGHAAALAIDMQELAALPTNTVRLPDKMKDWQKYRKLFA